MSLINRSVQTTPEDILGSSSSIYMNPYISFHSLQQVHKLEKATLTAIHVTNVLSVHPWLGLTMVHKKVLPQIRCWVPQAVCVSVWTGHNVQTPGRCGDGRQCVAWALCLSQQSRCEGELAMPGTEAAAQPPRLQPSRCTAACWDRLWSVDSSALLCRQLVLRITGRIITYSLHYGSADY